MDAFSRFHRFIVLERKFLRHVKPHLETFYRVGAIEAFAK